MKIKENYENVETFNFKAIKDTVVDKSIKSLNSNKAVAADKISAKILKSDRESFTSFITSLVNNSLRTSIFPDRLKEAQVTPLLKKNDLLDKKNYRPVCAPVRAGGGGGLSQECVLRIPNVIVKGD